MRLVDRIGEMLCFQTQPGILIINAGSLSGQCSVKRPARIEQHGRLRGEDFKHPSRSWISRARRKRQALSSAMKDKIMIVTFVMTQSVKALANCAGLGKVHRSILDRKNFSRRDQGLVRWGVKL